MSISKPFIERPVATTLLTLALGFSGAVAYNFLPVAPLPQVDFPSININTSLPGASPETMASSVATPLERQFGRIAGINEMTSSSTLGSTSITLQFDLARNIDAAARDVQAAINAARSQLPQNLPRNPFWRKVNPADYPILQIGLTSPTMTQGQMYDAASTIMAQKLSQVHGVGQVNVGGSALPGVRVEVNPAKLNHYGIALEDVRAMLAASNANRPKGELSDANQSWIISTTDQILKAKDYRTLLVAYRNGAPVTLSDVADVTDSVEDLRNVGYVNGNLAVIVRINRQPGANIVETVDKIFEVFPVIKASMPASMQMTILSDRTTTIRSSVENVQQTMAISIGLVIMVVFVFLRSMRITLIPSVVVPISLVGTFGVLYLFGYSIDNLSLMALTIATGFVVDDAIVVIENISRHIEHGMEPMQAALRGAQEIGFTVLSMSISLIAVFIPILLMPGIVGRLFREFAVVLSVSIFMSLLVSLTATPMMCARMLKSNQKHGKLYNFGERIFQWVLSTYGSALQVVLNQTAAVMVVVGLTVGVSVYLYIKIPKGFFPQQDTGRLQGNVQGQQHISYQALAEKVKWFEEQVRNDPAVDVVNVTAGSNAGGRGGGNNANMNIQLKSFEERGR